MIKELFNHNNYYLNPYVVLVLLTGLGLFGLGLLAIRKNPHQIVNRTFFYTSLSMTGWFFFASLNYFSKKSEVALKSGGFVLGMLPEISDLLDENEIKLNTADKVILYTDGGYRSRKRKRGKVWVGAF